MSKIKTLLDVHQDSDLQLGPDPYEVYLEEKALNEACVEPKTTGDESE